VFSLGGAQSDEIFKQKVNDCVQDILILQKSTNFHAIRSWSFRNICNEIGWPMAPFFAPPCSYGNSCFEIEVMTDSQLGGALIDGKQTNS